MSLLSIIKGILNLQHKIDLKKLPSQGLFYKDDFEIQIKKAELSDIIEYEYNYDREDLGIVITRLKKIVENNVILSNGYTYNDIKSIDVVFLFLEIVKLTNKKPIALNRNINIDKVKKKIAELIINFISINLIFF